MAGHRFGLFGPRETLNERLLREAGLEAASPAARDRAPASAEAPDPRLASDPEPEPPTGTASVEAVEAIPRAWPEPSQTLPSYEGSVGTTEPSALPPDWRPLASVTAGGLAGREIRFFELEDGSVIVAEQEGDASLDPLLDALEGRIEPPYEAYAIRMAETFWSISAKQIDVVELPQVGADEFTAARYGGALSVDDEPVDDRAPYAPLEQLATDRGQTDFFVEASRLEDALFAVALTPL